LGLGVVSTKIGTFSIWGIKKGEDFNFFQSHPPFWIPHEELAFDG
jgi:hypothetical protein